MNKYWNERYKSGGVSGDGSIGECRKYKWSIINKYINNISKYSVIDVGCGDLSFWDGKDCDNYIGIDSSDVIIEKNKLLRKKWKFLNKPSDFYVSDIKADVVFCFDMLFHIMDDQEYYMTLQNLPRYSNNYIFIYTWVVNPFKDPYYINSIAMFKRGEYVRSLKNLFFGIGDDSDGKYQKFRDFCKDRTMITREGFLTVGIFREPSIDPYGAMIVFKKSENNE
jgi:hypothetical protein